MCNYFELTTEIVSHSEMSDQVFETECFLTCAWRVFKSNILKQLQFKLGKNIWI